MYTTFIRVAFARSVDHFLLLLPLHGVLAHRLAPKDADDASLVAGLISELASAAVTAKAPHGPVSSAGSSHDIPPLGVNTAPLGAASIGVGAVSAKELPAGGTDIGELDSPPPPDLAIELRAANSASGGNLPRHRGARSPADSGEVGSLTQAAAGSLGDMIDDSPLSSSSSSALSPASGGAPRRRRRAVMYETATSVGPYPPLASGGAGQTEGMSAEAQLPALPVSDTVEPALTEGFSDDALDDADQFCDARSDYLPAEVAAKVAPQMPQHQAPLLRQRHRSEGEEVPKRV